MSLTRQSERIENPCKYYCDWKSTKEIFEYFDRDLGDDGERVMLELDKGFMVLDHDMMQVSGFTTKKGKIVDQYRSNSVRKFPDGNTSRVIILQKNGKEIMRGLYKDIKDLKPEAAKYVMLVYIMAWINGELQLACLVIGGSAAGVQDPDIVKEMREKDPDMIVGWRNLEGKYSRKFTELTFTLEGAVKDESQNIHFWCPTFKVSDSVDDLGTAYLDRAKELDRELQDYLDHYLVHGSPSEDDEPSGNTEPDDAQRYPETEKRKSQLTPVSKPKPKDLHIHWSFDLEKEITLSKALVLSKMPEGYTDEQISERLRWKPLDDPNGEWRDGLELFKPEAYAAKMQAEKEAAEAEKEADLEAAPKTELLGGMFGTSDESSEESEESEDSNEVSEDNIPF